MGARGSTEEKDRDGWEIFLRKTRKKREKKPFRNTKRDQLSPRAAAYGGGGGFFEDLVRKQKEGVLGCPLA